jgi:hypothetical protein
MVFKSLNSKSKAALIAIISMLFMLQVACGQSIEEASNHINQASPIIDQISQDINSKLAIEYHEVFLFESLCHQFDGLRQSTSIALWHR